MPDENKSYHEAVLKMLIELQSMRDTRLGQINVTKNRVELTLENLQSIRSASYRAGPKPRTFERIVIERMLSQLVIEPAQIE